MYSIKLSEELIEDVRESLMDQVRQKLMLMLSTTAAAAALRRRITPLTAMSKG